ncbi:MAG: hypothetical protein ABSA45_10940 [Verrucomicrobiota bacterium]
MRGIVSCPQCRADFAKGFILKIAEQDSGTVGIVQRVHGFVEQRLDLGPDRRDACGAFGCIHVVHLHGDLLAQLPARFFADDVNRGPARDLIQPRRQGTDRRDACATNFAGVAREVGEDGLRDFLGQLRRADLPQRGGKDQVQMSPDDFGEGVLQILSRVLPQQIQIACHSFESISLPLSEIRQKCGSGRETALIRARIREA